MKKLLLSFVISSLLVGCATQEPLRKQTASGKPEGIYPEYKQEQVVNAIVLRCNEKGFMVEEQNTNYVVCSKEMTGGGAIAMQLAIGNSYSTTPKIKARYSMSKYQNGTKVWVDAWSETQMAMGQINKMALDSNKTKNELQYVLDEEIPKILKAQ